LGLPRHILGPLVTRPTAACAAFDYGLRCNGRHLGGAPTVAGAILDRVVRNADRVELSGESLRKNKLPESRVSPHS